MISKYGKCQSENNTSLRLIHGAYGNEIIFWLPLS